MTSDSGGDRWKRIGEIFELALERPAEERAGFVAEACGDDQDLKRAVDELLAVDDQAEGFLSDPLIPSVDGAAEVEPAAVASPITAAGDARPKLRFGHYRVLRRLGEGGMSTVFLAVRDDDTFHRRVAIKLIRQGMESRDARRRLQVERQILASLDHPNIAKLFDAGTTPEGHPFFVMELIEGLPIDVHCERNRLSIPECLALFRKVCGAVHYAHQNLVVHRDIKPSNLLVTPDGEPKLLDFGIAKLLNPEMIDAEHEPTATWQRLLTPHYASPEQIRGEPITTASDVYSLGVMLYRLLTGRLPFKFDNRSSHEMIRTLTESEPPRPSTVVLTTSDKNQDTLDPIRGSRPAEVARDLKGDLDQILLKALRFAPHQRYASASDFSADLDRYTHGLPVLARQGGLRYRLGKTARRHWRAAAVGGTLLMLLLSVAITMTVYSARLARERDQKAELLRISEAKEQELESVLAWVVDLFRWADPGDLGGRQVTVLDALQNSERALSESFADQPKIEAVLRGTRGAILSNLGLTSESREEIERAIELYRRLGAPYESRVGELQSLLGLTYLEEGQFDDAEPLIAGALEAAERSEGPPDGEVGTILPLLNNLVTFHCYRQTYEEADALSARALDLARSPGVAAATLLDSVNNRAMVSRHTGDLAQSAVLYKEGLELQQRMSGDTAQVATLVNNYGALLEELEDWRGAEQSHLRALELRRRLLGDGHPMVSQSLYHLARNLRKQGRLEEAEVKARHAYEIYAGWESAGAYTTLSIAGELAGIWLELGELDAAKRLLTERLATVPRPAEPSKATKIRLYLPAKLNLGQALLELGDYSAAERHLDEALPMTLELGNPSTERRALELLIRLYELTENPRKRDVYERRLAETTTDG